MAENEVPGSSGFSLLLPFDTDDPEFTRGVEVGRLWELLKTGEEVRETVHATNAEMVMRLAEATGRSYETEEPFTDDWLFVHFYVKENE